MTYGYVRVSARDQNEARQMIAMRDYGVRDECVFTDKQSGKDFNRPEYRRMIARLNRGDVVVIKSIDRLGRNYDEILDQWRFIVKEKGCDVVVLDMPLLNTTQKDANGLMGKVIADIVLQLLSYVAQTEREFTKQRQAEGIAAAKARGIRFGPRPKARPREYGEIFQKWRDGEISAQGAAVRLGFSRNTFLKWARGDLEVDHAV